MVSFSFRLLDDHSLASCLVSCLLLSRSPIHLSFFHYFLFVHSFHHSFLVPSFLPLLPPFQPTIQPSIHPSSSSFSTITLTGSRSWDSNAPWWDLGHDHRPWWVSFVHFIFPWCFRSRFLLECLPSCLRSLFIFFVLASCSSSLWSPFLSLFLWIFSLDPILMAWKGVFLAVSLRLQLHISKPLAGFRWARFHLMNGNNSLNFSSVKQCVWFKNVILSFSLCPNIRFMKCLRIKLISFSSIIMTRMDRVISTRKKWSLWWKTFVFVLRSENKKLEPWNYINRMRFSVACPYFVTFRWHAHSCLSFSFTLVYPSLFLSHAPFCQNSHVCHVSVTCSFCVSFTLLSYVLIVFCYVALSSSFSFVSHACVVIMSCVSFALLQLALSFCSYSLLFS